MSFPSAPSGLIQQGSCQYQKCERDIVKRALGTEVSSDKTDFSRCAFRGRSCIFTFDSLADALVLGPHMKMWFGLISGILAMQSGLVADLRIGIIA